MRADDIGTTSASTRLREEVDAPCLDQRFDLLIKHFKQRLVRRGAPASRPAVDETHHVALAVYYRNLVDTHSDCALLGASPSSLVDRLATELGRLTACLGNENAPGMGTRVQIGTGEFVELVVQATAAGLIVSVVGPATLEGALNDQRRELERRLSGYGLSLASLRFSKRQTINHTSKSVRSLTTLVANTRTP